MMRLPSLVAVKRWFPGLTTLPATPTPFNTHPKGSSGYRTLAGYPHEKAQCCPWTPELPVTCDYLHCECCSYRTSKEHEEIMDDDVKWLFPAGPAIERLEGAAKNGILTHCQVLTINTRQPLDASLVLKVLSHLTKKLQPFRACLRRKGKELWVCELKDPKIDFKEVSGDPASVQHNPANYLFDSSQSVWRVLLQPCASPQPNTPPHHQPKFPHQYNLFIFLHHSLFDGVSSLTVAEKFVETLDDVSAGTSTVDTKQEDNLVSRCQSKAMQDAAESHLRENPRLADSLIRTLSLGKAKPLLIREAFKSPTGGSKPTTSHIVTKLEPSVTENLRGKCRQARVSINSGFASIFNTALVELSQEAGLVRDLYTVTSRHAVDERRYWGGHRHTDMGYQVVSMSHTMDTPSNNRADFWQYVQTFDREFKLKLENKYPYTEDVLRGTYMPEASDYEAFYSSLPALIYDYYISYINVSGVSMQGKQDQVLVTEKNWYSYVHNCEYPCLLLVDGFQHSYKFTTMYSTGHLTTQTAEAFHNKIIEVMHAVAS